MSIGHLLLLLILFAFGFCAYFLPGLVARARDHRNAGAIVVLNLFLGWTMLGWVIALIWAFTSDVHARAASPSLAPGGE